MVEHTVTDGTGKDPLPVLTAVPGGVPDIDADLREAAQAGVPVRVRLPLTVYDTEKGNYTTCRGVSWTLELPSLEIAQAFREDLDGFVRAWVLRKSGAVVPA